MARKRKIPVRKHHGIRDPLKQLEEREKKLRKVTNNPPDQSNDQKPSFKFTQFKKLVEDAKSGKRFKKHSVGQEDKPRRGGGEQNSRHKKKNSASTNTSIPSAQPTKQLSNESDAAYLRRVNRMTSAALADAQYSIKYGVNVVRDPSTGQISIQKRPKNEIDELLKAKNKKKRGGKVVKSKEKMDPKLVKELVKQAIKEDDEEAKPKFEEFKYDVVKFGEIVHAPPALSTLPRHAKKSETVPRPGKKNLLLKDILDSDATDDIKTNNTAKPKEKAGANIKKSSLQGKRKDLPSATRAMLETEQAKIIELYRQLKKSKSKELSS